MNTKNLLIAGGTGFLGRALVDYWLKQGHKLTIISRNPIAAQGLFGTQVTTTTMSNIRTSRGPFDAVVNLAGAPMFARRWSTTRKRILLDSRVLFTEQLIDVLSTLDTMPEVLLNASAIGIYGDQGDNILTEHSLGSNDFSGKLCTDWERAALVAEKYGIRVCLIRTGLVLDKGGGLLQTMLPAFRLGLGGPLGNGNQWMSWIHRHDWISIANLLLHQHEATGAFNATSPQPIRNLDFSTQLAKQLHRPALLPIPVELLRLLLGEMSDLALGSQRVIPERLLNMGHQFQFDTLERAFQQIIDKTAAATQ